MQPNYQTTINYTNRQLLVRLGIIATLVCCLMACWAFISRVRLPNALAYEKPPARQVIGQESTGLMAIKNREKLTAIFGTMATTISDQMFTEHYAATGNHDHIAEITTDLSVAKNTYTFTIVFSPSNDRMQTTITMKNATTHDYDLTMKKEAK